LKDPRLHKFIFITTEKSSCSKCEQSFNEFQEVLGMFSRFNEYQNALNEGKLEFLVADIMSLPLEELIPGDLPIILYLGHEQGQESQASVGVFYFDKNRFGRMVQLALNKPHSHIEMIHEFMNLLKIEFDL